MNEILVQVITPIALGFLGWFGNAYRNKQKKEKDVLDNVQQILDIQNRQIEKQNEYIEKQDRALARITAKDERKRESIKKAYNCKVPSEDCPVLIHDAQGHAADDDKCASCKYKKKAGS